ncbi:MAG: hypothetical protein ABR583_07610 [Gaiellaceae bacterium]
MKKKLISLLPVLALAAAFAAPSPAAGTAQKVAVKETNFKIKLSAVPRAGTVKFVVTNVAGIPHDFRLKGGGLNLKSKMLAGGSKATLTARLKKGVKYQVWCGVSGHATAGMKTSFVAR